MLDAILFGAYAHFMEMTLESLLKEESELQFSSFSSVDALNLGSLLIKEASTRGVAISIDIEMNSHQLFHYSFDGTSPDNDAWIARKNRLVRRFRHSSMYMSRLLAERGKTIKEAYLVDEADYAPHGGAFPLIIRGVGVVGTITVSGLHQAEDHKMVTDAISGYLRD